MDREEIKQIAYDFTTSKVDAEKLEERILSLFPVSNLAFQWGKTLTDEDLVRLSKKYFPKRSEKIAYYIGCRRSDLIKVYKGEHGC